MTRSEILGLSFLLEKDQLEVLDNFGIVQHKPYGEGDVITCTHPESLPDLADRLWREAIDTLPAIKINNSTLSVWRENDPHKVEFGDDRHDVEEAFRWLLLFAYPIHRIQAALLAKEGK